MYLYNNFKDNYEYIDKLIGYGESCDVCKREYIINKKRIILYFLDGLVNNLEIIGIMDVLLKLQNNTNAFDFIKLNIPHESIKIHDNFEGFYDDVLSGMIGLVIEDSSLIIDVETRKFPNRSISEPDTEKVIRGSHDGFTENLNSNIALVRRRIKDGKLRNKMFKVGEMSKTNVCLSYIEGLIDKKLIEDVKKRITCIHPRHLIMTDKALEENIIKQGINPYPLVRYTERPDIVSIHLYQGKFSIMVDTSPSAIIAPSTFFDHLQHTEEYRQTLISGTYLRVLRFIGVFISLFLTPLWFLMIKGEIKYNNIFINLIPTEDVSLSIFIQLIIAEVGVEFLRMASIHTPSALSTAMGLVAGVLVGNIAIDVGVFHLQTVFLVAVSSIGTYITPSYELGLANKLIKLILLILINFFGLYGFVFGTILFLISLIRMKSFNTPYLYPIIPFNLKKCINLLVRKTEKGGEKDAKVKM